MATIQSTIQINDKFSKALRSLSSGLDGVINKLKKVESTASKINFGSGFRLAAREANQLAVSMDKIAKSSKSNEDTLTAKYKRLQLELKTMVMQSAVDNKQLELDNKKLMIAQRLERIKAKQNEHAQKEISPLTKVNNLYKKITDNVYKRIVTAEQLVKKENKIKASIDKVNESIKKCVTSGKQVVNKFAEIDAAQNKINQKIARRLQLTNILKNRLTEINQKKLKSIGLMDKIRTKVAKNITYHKRVSKELDIINGKQNKVNGSVNTYKKRLQGVWGTLKRMAATYLSFQAAKTLVNAADRYTNTTARINMLTNSDQETEQLKNLIYESAQRSRASYTDMTNSVAKLGMLAGDKFNSLDEIVKFNEIVQKQFAISGSTVQEMSAAMYQLTQAMSSGELKGDEFKSIIENAPMIAQTIADYVGVSAGELKDLASEGLITSEVVKNAMFDAAAKTEEKFKQLPLSFGAMWQQVKNKIDKTLEPLYKKLQSIWNSDRFQNFVNILVNGFVIILSIASFVFDCFLTMFSILYDNWDIVASILLAVAVYYFPLLIKQIYATTAALIKQAIVWAITNWHIILIVAAIALVIYALYKMAGSFGEVCGYICGAVLFVGAVIGNIVIFVINLFSMLVQFIGVCLAWVVDKFIAGFTWIYNIASGCCQWIATAFGWLKDNLGVIFDNIGIFWSNLWISCQQMFYKFLNSVLSGISKLATPLKALAKLFGFDLGGAFDNMKAGLDGKVAELEGQKKEYLKTTSFKEAVGEVDWNTKKYDSDFSFKESVGKIDTTTIDYFNLGNAFDKGYTWGEEKGNNISSAIKSFNLFGKNSTAGQLLDNIDKVGGIGKTAAGVDNNPLTGGSPKTNDLLKQIRDNTAGTNDLMRNNEDMSYLRDLAERKAINNISDIKLNIDMTNNNTVNSDFDLDKIADYLGKKVFNTITSSAVGLHY